MYHMQEVLSYLKNATISAVALRMQLAPNCAGKLEIVLST